MATEAAMLLQAGNVQKWQKPLLFEAGGYRDTRHPHIGPDVGTFNPYGHISHPAQGSADDFCSILLAKPS
jgi:hypothetical protein